MRNRMFALKTLLFYCMVCICYESQMNRLVAINVICDRNKNIEIAGNVEIECRMR